MTGTLAYAKSLAAALILTLGLSTATFTATSVTSPSTAEAGILKKAKKGLKVIGKGARFVEKKTAKMGKVGKFVSKGARGLRKGTSKAARGVSKVQKGAKRAFGKVCRGACRKVVKAGKKVKKGVNFVKRQAEKKCRQFGRNSKACRIAREAMEFASPI
jgi:hypothetical protein